MVIPLIKKYGREFKKALVYDRISEELRTFCANHTIDEVYNEMFLELTPHTLKETRKSIERLLNNSMQLINLVIPKPDIPSDIAENYRKVSSFPIKITGKIFFPPGLTFLASVFWTFLTCFSDPTFRWVLRRIYKSLLNKKIFL